MIQTEHSKAQANENKLFLRQSVLDRAEERESSGERVLVKVLDARLCFDPLLNRKNNKFVLFLVDFVCNPPILVIWS